MQVLAVMVDNAADVPAFAGYSEGAASAAAEPAAAPAAAPAASAAAAPAINCEPRMLQVPSACLCICAWMRMSFNELMNP